MVIMVLVPYMMVNLEPVIEVVIVVLMMVVTKHYLMDNQFLSHLLLKSIGMGLVLVRELLESMEQQKLMVDPVH